MKSFHGTLHYIVVQMTCFVKVCTEFIPISIDCIIQVDIHAVLDADKKIWFNKTHKKEILELVLEKAKSRLLQSQTGQSVDKKKGASEQLRETTPEIITGKNIAFGIIFRKCGVRYNSVLATAEGIGVFQTLNCFKEKLIVYSYPLDQSSETSDVATVSSRHRIANEKGIENPAKVTEGGSSRDPENKITNFTHLINKCSSEAVESNKSPVTPRRQQDSNDISEVDKSDKSAAKRRKRTVGELSTKKKCLHLTQFKFRRTRAIQVLCHRASPSLNAKIIKRRSRSLGIRSVDNQPTEDNLQNRSQDEIKTTSRGVLEEVFETFLDEKSKNIPEERNLNTLDDKSVGVFRDRSRNISGKNLKETSGNKSTAAAMQKSDNRKLLTVGNVTLVPCSIRNDLAVVSTSKSGDQDKGIAVPQPGGEEGCSATSHQKKINYMLEDFSDKAVHPSKKRELDKSDSTVPVSKKKFCAKKSNEVELWSSSEFPRHHHSTEVGKECSSMMDKCNQVTRTDSARNNSGLEVRRNSKDEIRGKSNDEVTGRRDSNGEIRHFSAGHDARHCSNDDYALSSNENSGSTYTFTLSSTSKDCETDWTSDVKGCRGKDVTRNKHWTGNDKSVSSESCSVSVGAYCNTDAILSNKTNQISQKILDSDKDFRTAKQLPAQKSRRLATKKKKDFEKFLGDVNLDSSPVFIDDELKEKKEIDFGSTPSVTVNPQKKSNAISKHITTVDEVLKPSGYKEQIPDTFTCDTDSILKKDIRLPLSAGIQPVDKRLDGSLSSASIIPALCDARVSSLSHVSTGLIDSTEPAGSQSCFDMETNANETVCDQVVTKPPIQSDVIIIESDTEDDVEAEIKAVHAVGDLTTSQLRHLVFSNETYLRKIFQGKIPCRRHEDYKAGKEKRRALSWNLPVGVFSDEQYSQILCFLKDLFCREHEKYLDYLMMVLLPEMLVKIFMFVHDLNYEEAEARIEENEMELSEINRFTF